MKVFEAGSEPSPGKMYFVYGAQGTGKTSIVKQFEGRKLLFSFDLSSDVIGEEDNTTVFQFEESDLPKIQGAVNDLVHKSIASNKYQVIILDNLSALQNYVLENIDNASKDGRQNYQKLQVWFRTIGIALRLSGKTVYATAHQVDNGANGLDDRGRFAPDMNEKTFNAFTSMFDVVGRLYVDKDERFIDLNPETNGYSKNRLDNRKLIKASELVIKNQEKKEVN